MNIVISLVVGYLLGSISFPIVITRLVLGKDIRTLGDGNAGAANVAREVGKMWGVGVWILDVCKGIVPMAISQHILKLDNIWVVSAGISAVIGHCWPIYFRFYGGKGAATSSGVILYIVPLLFLPLLIFWFGIQHLGPRNKWLIVPVVMLFYTLLFLFYRSDFPWLFPSILLLMGIVMLASRSSIREIIIER